MNNYYYIASTYGSGDYNTSTYNGTDMGSNGGNSALTDTGIAIAVVVTAACLIALLAIAVKIWKRPSKKAVLPSAE